MSSIYANVPYSSNLSNTSLQAEYEIEEALDELRDELEDEMSITARAVKIKNTRERRTAKKWKRRLWE